MLIRLCICIPTYNNPTTIVKVITDCVTQTPYPIVVVDDGSDIAVSFLAKNVLAVSQRLTIFRFEKNQGKGKALLKGFQWALSNNFTHVLTIDADGQHHVSDISAMVEAVCDYPLDLILGCRNLNSTHVPKSSIFGRHFSNFWVKVQTGTQLRDSQTGFRVYPLYVVQLQTFYCKRFDFEIEILIRLLWKNTTIHEVPVNVTYFPKEYRVSHFHKWKDNLRISLLNTVLVILSIFKHPLNPKSIAWAVGLGVFIGVSPFYGLHSLMVIVLSMIFRLNVVFMWLGSQISIPPLVPVLIFLSVVIGFFITGQLVPSIHLSHVWETAPVWFFQWFMGSVILGFFLGVVFGLLSYFFAKKNEVQNQHSLPWTGKMRGGVFGNWFIHKMLIYCRKEYVYAFVWIISGYFYVVSWKARNAFVQYWRTLDPNISWWNTQWHVLKHFHEYGLVLIDRLYQSVFLQKDFEIVSQGIEHLEHAITKNRGVVLVTAHVGAWDIAAKQLSSHMASSKTPLHIVEYNPPGKAFSFHKLHKTESSRQFNRLFLNEESMPILKIRELLTQNHMVALMGDRPMGRHFELVQFMGKLALVDTTPFEIKFACDSELIMTFGWKNPLGQYEFYAYPFQDADKDASKTKEQACFDWAQQFAYRLEQQIRQHPFQWFNFYSFWSYMPNSRKIPKQHIDCK